MTRARRCTTATRCSASCRYRSNPRPMRCASSWTCLAPRGGIAEEVKGLALAQGADGKALLVVSDVSAERFSVVRPRGQAAGPLPGRRGRQGGRRGRERRAGARNGRDGRRNSPRACSSSPTRTTTANTATSSWSAGARRAPHSLWRHWHLRILASQAATVAHTVTPALETPAVATWGDAADDPAIWVNPQDPAKSAVIATDKNLGLYVYDLDGTAAADTARRAHEQRGLARRLHGRRQGAHDRGGQQPHRQVDRALLARSGNPQALARGRPGADGNRRSLRALHVRGRERALRLRQQQ